MTYIGTMEINKELTDYIQHLRAEVVHYDEAEKWLDCQENIPADLTEQVKSTLGELKQNLQKEQDKIRESLLPSYPTMTRFEIGEGKAYVWGD